MTAPERAKLTDAEFEGFVGKDTMDYYYEGWVIRESARDAVDAAADHAYAVTRAKAIKAAAGLVAFVRFFAEQGEYAAISVVINWNKFLEGADVSCPRCQGTGYETIRIVDDFTLAPCLECDGAGV